MSELAFNNVIPSSVYYNGFTVTEAYCNDTLVWRLKREPLEWVGWANATWQDVYDLCKRKQADTEFKYDWPEDVYELLSANGVYGGPILQFVSNPLPTQIEGATSNLNMIPGPGPVSAKLIGVDKDGPGTLTFLTSQWKQVDFNYNLYNYFRPPLMDEPYEMTSRKNYPHALASMEMFSTFIDKDVVPLIRDSRLLKREEITFKYHHPTNPTGATIGGVSLSNVWIDAGTYISEDGVNYVETPAFISGSGTYQASDYTTNISNYMQSVFTIG